MNTRANTYVLLHGAWHGSWSWRYVAPILERDGNVVYTPDLPGHWNNKMPLQNIELATYINSISNLLLSIDSQVVLVGHSMSGVVISQIAQNFPDRIATCVYVSGFIPDMAGSLADEEQKGARHNVMPETLTDMENNIVCIKHSQKIRDIFYGECSEDDYRYAIARLQDQPLRPFIDKVDLTDEAFGSVHKVYIECLRDVAIDIEDQRNMHSKISCDVFTLDADHSPFFSGVDDLCEILLRNVGFRS